MSSFLTAVAGTGTGSYLTDQAGQPYMLRGEQVWGIITMAGQNGGATTYQTDIDNYTSTRASQGFNVAFTAAPAASNHTSGAGAADGSTWDGVNPFTSPGVLNSTYWARVDYLISSAAAQGMTVLLNVAPGYTFYNVGGAQHSWTTANWTTFGTNLGNRYKTAANLVWVYGDDYFDDQNTNLQACIDAVHATGDTHMITVENYPESTSRKDTFNGTVLNLGTSNASFNWAYSYNTGYDAIEDGYEETSALAVVHGDGFYDTGAIQPFMRNLVWWALSSGSRGFSYGREAIWPWATTSLAALTTNNTDNTDLKIFWNTFASFTGWHLLAPDTGSVLVTAGRGTHSSELTSGGGGGQYAGGNTYVSAGKTADGKLAVIYIPSNVTVTVDGSQMAAGYTATWVDPASGAASPATIASTYSHAGTNSAGAADWLLVLQVPNVATTPPPPPMILRNPPSARSSETYRFSR